MYELQLFTGSIFNVKEGDGVERYKKWLKDEETYRGAEFEQWHHSFSKSFFDEIIELDEEGNDANPPQQIWIPFAGILSMKKID